MCMCVCVGGGMGRGGGLYHLLPASLGLKKVLPIILLCLFLKTKEKTGDISLG